MHAVFYLHAVLFACPMRLSTALTTLITWHFLAQPGLQISRLSGKGEGSFGNGALLGEVWRQPDGSKVAGAFRYDLEIDFPYFGFAFSDLRAGFCLLFCCSAAGQIFFLLVFCSAVGQDFV